MPIRISKTVTAEVAHCLPSHPIERNTRVHGHSLVITVTAEAERQHGMVCDFDVFGVQIGEIVKMIDHRCLNEDRPEIDPPTLENLTEWFGHVMQKLGPWNVVSVKIERPTCGQAAEWTP